MCADTEVATYARCLKEQFRTDYLHALKPNVGLASRVSLPGLAFHRLHYLDLLDLARGVKILSRHSG